MEIGLANEGPPHKLIQIKIQTQTPNTNTKCFIFTNGDRSHS